MGPIEQITIGGFRGILKPLRLDFMKGKTARSMAIYGRNGTGKSSITDAWEWFHTEKIDHLAREGAGPSAYPHRNAEEGETFIEVHFEDESLDTVRLDFDHSRITIPRAEGDIEEFRALAPHPCHIRFGDLTRFVYLTKADKYDALATLMGFKPQVELQKALRRVLRNLEERVQKVKGDVRDKERDLTKLLGLAATDEGSILDALNTILARHQIESVDSLEDMEAALKELAGLVEQDAGAQELNSLEGLHTYVHEAKLPGDLGRSIKDYIEDAKVFQQQERLAVNLFLLGLYEQGEKVVTERRRRGEETNCCPLCGQPFEGDLLEHIKQELSTLTELKRIHTALKKKRRVVLTNLRSLSDLSESLREACSEIGPMAEKRGISSLIAQGCEVESVVDSIIPYLEIEPEKLDAEIIGTLADVLPRFERKAELYRDNRRTLITDIERRIKILQKDESRVQLANDHADVREVLRIWDRLDKTRLLYTGLSHVYTNFDDIVEDYVENSIDNVRRRFEIISSDVQTYFAILEEQTEGIEQPVIRLLTDQDRAVVLEIKFRGERIAPAYRYLSESQLNSFGLAVFLASAKRFNHSFPFLILDDVINSFDGYKRPQVIRLLKEEFPEHQVVLLTHDTIWYDDLIRACPDWIMHRFVRLEPGIGPIDMEGVSTLRKIRQLIRNDEPVSAGREMGPFLERQFQELCEAFGAMVRYNRRNEYSLNDLLIRFRERVRSKLGNDHKLTRVMRSLETEPFRNFCAHWKDPDIQITAQEMTIVVDKWQTIEDFVRCPECNRYLRYYDDAFYCPSPDCTTCLRK